MQNVTETLELPDYFGAFVKPVRKSLGWKKAKIKPKKLKKNHGKSSHLKSRLITYFNSRADELFKEDHIKELLELMDAVVIHQDSCGKLWKAITPKDDDDFLVVEVVNATKEPDGTYKTYYLTVHPQLRPIPSPETIKHNRQKHPLNDEIAKISVQIQKITQDIPDEYSHLLDINSPRFPLDNMRFNRQLSSNEAMREQSMDKRHELDRLRRKIRVLNQKIQNLSYEDLGYGDPQDLTARNAVASTFGLRGEDYQPSIET